MICGQWLELSAVKTGFNWLQLAPPYRGLLLTAAAQGLVHYEQTVRDRVCPREEVAVRPRRAMRVCMGGQG